MSAKCPLLDQSGQSWVFAGDGLAVTVSAATLYFNIPVSRAFADAPWCAVTDGGTGNMYWDCQYRSIEECRPNVLVWNIGFLRLPKAAYTQIISPELSVHVGNARLGICLARARWLRRQLKHSCLLPLT